ncbi:MAG: hypothetical protein LC672_04595 [Acidobacteria bacterium]|nr:hypothetical protein [Acidobacteriota bacterium]
MPKDGVLLFFDVKPVFIKAYGGRRWTSAKRLVLPAQQRTRGKFYLFLLYDVSSGRVRWRYLPGKSSHYVCQFMRRVRRWYPEQVVWVGPDQDRPHPRISRQTRREMRRLKLRRVSLPKRSPDDNPVETIFSDIQQMILDNSNDVSAQVTRHRITAHLRKRNRRKDRYPKIKYLGDTHK